MKIKLNELDMSLQTRAEMNQEAIADYAELYRSGGEMPPITVVKHQAVPFLVDGYHRVAAARQAGMLELEAVVTDGDHTAALSAALQANVGNGVYRSNADKLRALEIAWENRGELLGSDSPSNREIAKLICVSYQFVNDNIDDIKVTTVVTPPTTPPAEEESETSDEAFSSPSVRGLKSKGLDRFGVKIPERILGAFDTAPVSKIMRQIRGLRQAILTAQNNGELAYLALPQEVTINLENASREIKYAMPWCVCRGCNGAGCYRCSERGFMTIPQYKQLPGEWKVKPTKE